MERDEGQIMTVLMERIQPYKDRIVELEKSIADKETEAVILRLAVERLGELVKKLEGGGHKKGPPKPKRGKSRAGKR